MIKELTSLRGIFILFIFFHHCLNLYTGGGSLAVTFFFIASGFSLTLGYHNRVKEPTFSFKQYITRRAVKFYPLHWICLLVSLPLVFTPSNWKQLPILVTNAALMQSWIPMQDIYFSFNSVSWFLSDILFFAAVFPFVYRWIDGASQKSRYTVVIAVLIFYVVLAISLPPEHRHAVLYINPLVRLLDFMFGIFLAKIFLQLKDNNRVNDVIGSHRLLVELIIITTIALLVIESCILSKDVRLISPVYWLFVSTVIVLSALLGINGGGIFCEVRYSRV